MSKKKIQILVACHKSDKVYSDEVYVPIHVGRSVSNMADKMQDMIGDDTGENISPKNPNYCELTAQYWAWKNLDAEYVGLCHYRRYFETLYTAENIDMILGNHRDVILAKPIYERRSVGTRLIMTTCAEDVYIFSECFKKMHHEYYNDFQFVLSSTEVTRFNMFVMKKVLFDEFAKWQFSVFEEMEKYVKLSSYSRMRRLYGYLAEMMLSVYCRHHKLRVHYDYVVPMQGEHVECGFKDSIKEKFKSVVCKRLYSYKFIIPDTNAIRTGLKNDGIVL